MRFLVVFLFIPFSSYSQEYRFKHLTSEIYNGIYHSDTTCTSFSVIITDSSTVFSTLNKCDHSFMGGTFTGKFKIINGIATDHDGKRVKVIVDPLFIRVEYPNFFDNEPGWFTFEN